MKRQCIPLILTLLLCLGATLQAQGQKIGFVNSNKIFQELPEAKEAQKRLDAAVKPIQDTLEAKQKEIETKYEEYQKKEALMTDAAKKTAQQEIVELQQRFQTYRQEKLASDGELARKQEQIINPIKEKILKGIERVAKEEKYNFVFDQTEAVKVLLYGDPSADLTFKVIDRLKRGK